MQALAAKRLVIFAGKGGVGKTTCSAATAIALAKAGRKTMLVTVDPAKRLEDSLGVRVGFTETHIQPNLTAMMLDPATVIKEHFEREIPDAKITEHPLFKQVSAHLPGLNELMAIGKLNDLRKAGLYDVIVVDTAPTGHALGFLGAPKAVQGILSDKSLVKWAIRGYGVWQRLSGAARTFGNVLKRGPKEKAPPDIDFEKVFEGMQEEAERIRAFLMDPEHSALVLVTIPEKLPVEETIDLHDAVTKDLGMHVHAVVINKVQPDALGKNKPAFDAVTATAAKRKTFVTQAAAATSQSESLVESLLEATQFSEIRRDMNLEYVEQLRTRLPEPPIIMLRLWKHDVQGLKRLTELSRELMEPGNRVEGKRK